MKKKLLSSIIRAILFPVFAVIILAYLFYPLCVHNFSEINPCLDKPGNIFYARNEISQLAPEITLEKLFFQNTFQHFQKIIIQLPSPVSSAQTLSFSWKTFKTPRCDLLRAVNVTGKNFKQRWAELLTAEEIILAQKAILNVEKLIRALDNKKTKENGGKNPRNGAAELAVRQDCCRRNQYAADALVNILGEYRNGDGENVIFANNGKPAGGQFHAFVLFKIGKLWFLIDAAADQFESEIEDSKHIGLVIMPAGEGLVITGEGYIKFKKADTAWAFNNHLRRHGFGYFVYGDGTSLRKQPYDQEIQRQINHLKLTAEELTATGNPSGKISLFTPTIPASSFLTEKAI